MLVTATGTTRQTCSARTSAASGNVRTPPSISPTSSTSGALWNICGNCVTLARSCRSIKFRSRERMRSTVKDVITPKFATSFDKQAGTAEQLVAQAGVAREADVHATGISAIDSDSATALVAGTFTDSYAKGGQQAPVPFRIEVSLVKTDGEWLVDNFSPVTGAAQ